MKNIILKNIEWCTIFPSLGFYPKGFNKAHSLIDGHPKGSAMN